MSDSDWHGDDDEEEEVPTEERAQRLEALAAGLRERLGDEEWRRLTRLVRTSRAATAGWGIALIAAAWLCLRSAFIGILVLLSRLFPADWRLPLLNLGRSLLYLAVAVGVGAVSLTIDMLATASVRRSLQAHEDQGEDAHALWQALWAYWEVPRIRGELANQARMVADQALLPRETEAAPSRWQVELSGAYLVWWLCAAFWVTSLVFRWPLSSRVLDSIAIVTISGLLFRLILLAVLRAPRQNPSDRRSSLRFYWWWARGWLPAAIALLPGVLFWVVSRALGRR